MAPATASPPPPTTLTDQDFKRHPLGEKAFEWRQQQGDISAEFEWFQDWYGGERFKMLKALNAIPHKDWHLWEKAVEDSKKTRATSISEHPPPSTATSDPAYSQQQASSVNTHQQPQHALGLGLPLFPFDHQHPQTPMGYTPLPSTIDDQLQSAGFVVSDYRRPTSINTQLGDEQKSATTTNLELLPYASNDYPLPPMQTASGSGHPHGNYQMTQAINTHGSGFVNHDSPQTPQLCRSHKYTSPSPYNELSPSGGAPLQYNRTYDGVATASNGQHLQLDNGGSVYHDGSTDGGPLSQFNQIRNFPPNGNSHPQVSGGHKRPSPNEGHAYDTPTTKPKRAKDSQYYKPRYL